MNPPRRRPVGTVDDVVDALGEIVEWAVAAPSPAGYFAAIYLGMTVAVRDAIAAEVFADARRMAEFDVCFASRYLDAFWSWHEVRGGTASWQVAFAAATEPRYTIFQHLLVGVNAHMRLDLAVAAAATAPGPGLPGLRPDFLAINEVLTRLIPRDRQIVLALSPRLVRLEWLTVRENWILGRMARTIRDDAWTQAEVLAACRGRDLADAVTRLDEDVAGLARAALDGRRVFGWLSKWVKGQESSDVATIIRRLAWHDGQGIGFWSSVRE